MRPRPRRRGGFSLAELLLIMVLIGILAGVAVPSMRKAVDQADAAKVMTDVRNVTLAVRQYMEANSGALPASAAWGAIPPALTEYLPEASAFTYKSLSYRVVTQRARGTTRLIIRYPRQDPIGMALRKFTNADITWTNTRLTVWIVD
ncbi:MAG: hypothetical protein AMXMBFR53_03280 [Gemmatimonadota bacterium]